MVLGWHWIWPKFLVLLIGFVPNIPNEITHRRPVVGTARHDDSRLPAYGSGEVVAGAKRLRKLLPPGWNPYFRGCISDGEVWFLSLKITVLI